MAGARKGRGRAGRGPGTPAQRATAAGRSATSWDVARLAGVSRSAVSRTFTPDASVSERTRRKVMAAAERLGYRPNVLARSLIMQRSRLIGLVMGEWGNPFYTPMLRGFSEKLQVRGYQVMLLTRGPDGGVDDALRMLMQYRVDGVVLVSCDPSPAAAAECSRAGIRLVFVNREPGGLPATGIVADNASIGREVAELLVRAGYERLAVVRGDRQLRTGIERTEAFEAAVAASGRARIVIDQGDVVGYEAGRRFIHEAMRRDTPPDAIFCSSDLTAIGVLDGARVDLRIPVPDALAVVGFGDAPAAAWAANDLTTVGLPVERMIDAAVETLVAEAAPAEPRLTVIKAGLVRRATVRLVPPARS